MSYKSYITTLDNIDSFLEEHGVAVIPGILSTTEIDSMQNGMWNILEQVTEKFDIPINRHLESTWVEFFKLYPLHSMMLQHYSIGHHQEVWNVRQNEQICNVFSKIWNSDKKDMVTSFDGISIHLPHETTKRGYYKNNDWYHTDQSYLRNNKECIQGFVTAFDINDGDATLTFLKGSHKYHGEVAKKFNLTSPQDWHKLSDEQLAYYVDRGCDKECIMAPAGSIILWDSRLIHSGREPSKIRSTPNFRFIVYVCQLPKTGNEKEKTKKIKAFNELRITSHWPHKTKMFSKVPRTYGGTLYNVSPPTSAPVLSELGKSLAYIDN